MTTRNGDTRPSVKNCAPNPGNFFSASIYSTVCNRWVCNQVRGLARAQKWLKHASAVVAAHGGYDDIIGKFQD